MYSNKKYYEINDLKKLTCQPLQKIYNAMITKKTNQVPCLY